MRRRTCGKGPGWLRRNGSCAAWLLMLSLTLTGCGEAGKGSEDLMKGQEGKRQEQERQETEQSAEQQLIPVSTGTVSFALTDFGVRLLQNQLEQEGNVLVSPLSVLSALAMTANGARQETLVQMEKVFGIPLEELNPCLRDFRKALPDADKYRLSMANAIWIRDADFFETEQDFLDKNAEYYGAGLYRAPFDETTLAEINSWVEEHTDGMVRDILDQIPGEEVMYLVNALAFDGEWQEIYFDYQVQDGEFTLEDGTVRETRMMLSEESVYLEEEEATGFVKYYADRKYAFVALLPREGLALEEYIASLDGEKLMKILSESQEATVWARMPKFESAYSVELGDTLKQMGMSDAFDGVLADFSGIGHSDRGNLFISRVLHKTYIAVDERGTRAGAATVVAVEDGGGAMDPGQIREVCLDRPFLYMIVECESGTPVFLGLLREP